MVKLLHPTQVELGNRKTLLDYLFPGVVWMMGAGDSGFNNMWSDVNKGILAAPK